jgi:hypothetical protein
MQRSVAHLLKPKYLRFTDQNPFVTVVQPERYRDVSHILPGRVDIKISTPLGEILWFKRFLTRSFTS